MLMRNPKMRIFADEWLTGEHTGKRFHATAAFEYAGYSLPPSNPSTNASKMLRHPEVQAYIKQQLDELSMSAEEVLLRFTEIARSEVGAVVTKDINGHLKIDPDAVIDNKQFIKQFGFDANGNPKIEFHDSLAALRDIARVRAMFKDGMELTGSGGGPVTMKVVFVGDPELERRTQEPEEDFSEFE